MASSIFVWDLLIAFVAAAALLWRYANWKQQPILVTLAVLLAWYFSLLIIFVIPLDVSSTIYTACSNSSELVTLTTQSSITEESHTSSAAISSDVENGTKSSKILQVDITTPLSSLNISTIGSSTELPSAISHNITKRASESASCPPPSSLLPDGTLLSLWRVVYWTSQLLTWIILPLMQSFSQAGEFTFLGKLRSSLWDNAIYYTSYLLIAIILIVYIALQPGLHLTWGRTKAIAAAASNTWGLCLLVLMLGYGLVEVPRNLWQGSKRGHRLSQAYFRVSKLWTERSDAEGQLEEVLTSVEVAGRGAAGVLLRSYFDTIVAKVPTELMERVRRRQGRQGGSEEEQQVTEQTLAKLHKQVVVALIAHKRTEAQWVEHIERVLWLEDTQRNMANFDRAFKRQTEAPDRGWLGFLINPTTEWYWRCLLQPRLYQTGAVVALLFSVILTWSEVTLFSEHPTLSLMALFIQAGQSDHSYGVIEMISFLTICYMCICAYYTIFHVRVLNYYYLAPNHQSDEYTLLFSGALLCRLTPPLCLNFLSLIHMDSHVIHDWEEETAYTRVMGHMDVVSIVSDAFNIYFPILLLILTLATYFSLGSRLLTFLGFQQFLEEAGHTGELVEEGRELVAREKRRRERLVESSKNRREFREQWGDSMPSSKEARLRATASSQQAQENTGLQSNNSPNYSTPTLEVVQEHRRAPRNLFDDI